MVSRRKILSGTAALAGGTALRQLFPDNAMAQEHPTHHAPSSPDSRPDTANETLSVNADVAHAPAVVTPNGSALGHVMKDGVKEFHLVAEPVEREFAPGMTTRCWGYNGQTPGPTIEAVEGDRVRILVTNRLPEHTSVHWHGILLPNGMDGVGGLTQPHIGPGETFAYEFTLRQHGTYTYHPHADEAVQMAMGMMGFLIVRPLRPTRRIDRDFCIFLHEWYVEPSAYTPNPNIMTDFNLFTFNSRAFPGTAPLVVRRGERVRIRFANVSMDSHPIHIHGHRFWVVETDGGQIPDSAWWPETTMNVPPGTTRAVEFVADNPGDWPLHCHKTHHAMNVMNHDIPNVIGVDQTELQAKLSALVPGARAHGSTGMAEHARHQEHGVGLPNTLPMMGGRGPFGSIEMGGMFTVVKIREGITTYEDPGWYEHPAHTVAWKIEDGTGGGLNR